MLTLLEVLCWVVLFPVICTYAVKVYWRRKLQARRGEPPMAAIAGFIFGGWYGYVVAFCFLAGGNLLLLFNFPRTAIGIQQQIGAEFVCSIVGLATAFAGKSLAKRMASSPPNAPGDSDQTPTTDSHDNLNSI